MVAERCPCGAPAALGLVSRGIVERRWRRGGPLELHDTWIGILNFQLALKIFRFVLLSSELLLEALARLDLILGLLLGIGFLAVCFVCEVLSILRRSLCLLGFFDLLLSKCKVLLCLQKANAELEARIRTEEAMTTETVRFRRMSLRISSIAETGRAVMASPRM